MPRYCECLNSPFQENAPVVKGPRDGMGNITTSESHNNSSLTKATSSTS